MYVKFPYEMSYKPIFFITLRSILFKKLEVLGDINIKHSLPIKSKGVFP